MTVKTTVRKTSKLHHGQPVYETVYWESDKQKKNRPHQGKREMERRVKQMESK